MKASRKEIIKLLTSNLLRGLLGFVVIGGLFLAAREFLPDDFAALIEPWKDKQVLVYSIFLVSEIIIGLIPPEVFMFWALGKGPVSYSIAILIMAVLSYLGGIIAFYLGKLLFRSNLMSSIKKLKNYRAASLYYRRFGGILILISAITPLPFALFSFISGSFDYTFKTYMAFASARAFRFFFYGYLVWQGSTITF